MTTTTSAAEGNAGGGGTASAAVSSPSPPNLMLQPVTTMAVAQQRPMSSLRAVGGTDDNGGLSSAGSPLTSPAGAHQVRPSLLMDVAIRCTAPSCSCDCFSPCKSQIRTCDGCGHGWVSHALDKLGFRHLFNCHQVELVQPSIAFDIASLMLYGTQAIPVRLKILLDRLFSVLQHEEVLQVLHGFGWTYEDYARGYILQDPSGHVLERWLLASREEEPLILQQFLRFGETKAIAQQLLLQESSERTEFVIQSPRTESDIKKFIERTNRSSVGVPGSLFKQHGMHVYPQITATMPTLPLAGNRPVFRQPSSSVSSTQSVSPTVSSPVNPCTSPSALSPLNKLQNMHPYDYRHHDKDSPEPLSSTTANSFGVMVTTPNSVPTNSYPSVVQQTASSLISVCSSITTNNSSTYTTASSDPVSGNEDGGVAVYSTDMDDDDEDPPTSAMNLTRSGTGSYMDSVYAAKKVRHLRKSANPMKRRWNPTVLATLATNPATGKKRVQCHVCLKTFCDKGALKIHFSAVHLREMHKCTVDGCNMMFSSRRSRNRHSANPNPKLHTPNYRRKINPHDGRAANPYPLIPASGMMDFNNGLMTSFSSSGPHDGDSSSCSDAEQHVAVRAVSAPLEHRVESNIISPMHVHDRLSRHHDDEVPLPLTKKYRSEVDETSDFGDEGIDLTMKDDRRIVTKFSSPEKSLSRHMSPERQLKTPSENLSTRHIKVEGGSDEIDATRDYPKVSVAAEHFSSNLLENVSKPSDLSIKNDKDSVNDLVPKTEASTIENHKVSSNNDTEKESHLVNKEECLPSTKNVRKRKSLNPTKCPPTSDDDLQYVSTDDSSSDTYIDREADENGLMDSKSDFLSSDGSDSLNDIDDFDDNQSDIEKEKKSSHRTSKCSTPPPPSAIPSESHQKNSLEHLSFHNHEKYNGFRISDIERFRNELARNPYKEGGDDVSENPLRHLESLTLGAFNNGVLANRMNHHHHHTTTTTTTNVSSGVSYHAPGLGLASVTTTTATSNRAESPLLPSSERVPPLICSNSLIHHQQNTITNNNSDTENSMSEQQMPLLPVYRDASIVGSVEIPVDKENPRRCTACGKIFQNHFGVKTHYQNVHLKLMHKCTVEGCNAAFPSKRSRDRHSANLNLHRKLLSTSSDKSSGAFFDKSVYPFHPDAAFRGEFFSRFYDPQSLPLSFAELYHNRLSESGGGSPFLAATPPFANHLAATMPGFHPAFLPHSSHTTVSPFTKDAAVRYLRNEETSGRNSSVSSFSNPSSPGPSLRGSSSPRNRSSPSVKLEEDLAADSEGRYACTICEKKFHEGVVLREHYEKYHTQALLHCTTDGCNKAFLSKKSRNVHSDSLHKEVPSAEAT